MPYFQNENDNLFYTYKKAKRKKATRTIIFIHANIMDHTIFDSMIPLFSDDFHIITYDLRGFGLSDLGKKELTLDLYVNDLKCLITSLRLKSVYMAGFGFGGLIALQFSIFHEQIVKKLVLM